MRRALFLCLCVSSVSCQNSKYGDHPPYPTQGQVVINGQAAQGAMVVFHHDGDWGERTILPQAVTDAEGRFVLSTYDAGDGAPAGDYKVTIEWPTHVRRKVGPDKLGGRF